MSKRFFDIGLSLLALFLALPLMVMIGFLILIKSGRPIFFGGERQGRNGRRFKQIKFRTMVAGSDNGWSRAASNDNRITGIGRYLRKWKLDELPQLVNVVVGDMSVVGPRPDVPEYMENNDEARRLLALRPGLVDWATLWAINEGEWLARHENAEEYYEQVIHPTKLFLQLDYLQNHSIWVDCQIVAIAAYRLLARSRMPEVLQRKAEQAQRSLCYSDSLLPEHREGQMKRIWHSTPHLGELEMKFVSEALESNWIAPVGPQLDLFEEELASYVGAHSAVAVSSGTAAIHLALASIGLGAGDYVFCTDLTFIASVAPAVHLGATPVLIDSDPTSWGMSSKALARAIADAADSGKMPKAVIVAHPYGHSADMSPILAICKEYDVMVIEDAASSLGATYHGKPVGTLGRMGIYSFNGNKIITTGGGGAIVSDDESLIEKARILANQAREPVQPHLHRALGFNYRLSNVLAAIGRGQLRVIDERIAQRRANYAFYVDQFRELNDFVFLSEAPYEKANFWLSALRVSQPPDSKKRDEIMSALESENIEARPVWLPQHLQPVFEHIKYYQHDDRGSVSAQLHQQGICLPSGSNLSRSDLWRVVSCIKNRVCKN